jgi:GTPase
MTHEHLAIALVLAVPLIVVITKADATPPDTMAATIVCSVKCMSKIILSLQLVPSCTVLVMTHPASSVMNVLLL